jgi:hypothetical protein
MSRLRSAESMLPVVLGTLDCAEADPMPIKTRPNAIATCTNVRIIVRCMAVSISRPWVELRPRRQVPSTSTLARAQSAVSRFLSLGQFGGGWFARGLVTHVLRRSGTAT